VQCFFCQAKNTGGVLYCVKCGAKLDMTADEIQAYYAQKVRDEKKHAAEFHARRLLYFSIVLLLIAITFWVMAGEAPENTSYIPSATVHTEYMKMEYDFQPGFPDLYIPEMEQR
jgi:hypothetical protein